MDWSGLGGFHKLQRFLLRDLMRANTERKAFSVSTSPPPLDTLFFSFPDLVPFLCQSPSDVISYYSPFCLSVILAMSRSRCARRRSLRREPRRDPSVKEMRPSR